MVGSINLHDGRFKYDYKGFCSIINQVIDLCDYHYSRYGNLNFIFNEHQMDKIFNFKSRYGDRVIFNNENIISNNDKPVHFNNDRNLINLQVINDVYILSKSKCLYYTFSNVSYFALILGFDNFLKTINLNNLL